MRRFLPLLPILMGLGIWLAGQTDPDQARKKDEEKILPPVIQTEITVRADAPIISGNLLTPDLISTSRVSREQMVDLQATDLLTGLRMTPGIVIARYNLVGSYGGGSGGALFIRGLGTGRPGSEIQFLVDGVPKFSGVWTHPLMDVLPLDIIGSVDVVKGASPVLFGNMAFGAVEIRTRRMVQEGWEVNATAGGGSFMTLLTSVDAGCRTGKFDTFVTAGYRTSDGHRPQSAGRLEDFFGRAGYELSPGWRLDATLSRTDNYAEDPGMLDAAPPPRGEFAIRDWTAMVALENSTGAAEGVFRFYYDSGAIRWDQWNVARQLPEDSDTDYANWGFRARQTAHPAPWMNLTAGFDWDSYGGSFTNTIGGGVSAKEEVRFWNAAPYVLVGAEWGERVKVKPVAGLRWNRSRYFGSFLAPEGGLSVTFGSTCLHASASNGFNLPGVYAVFSYEDWHQGDDWKSLDPEKVFHLEAGISHAFRRGVRLDLTVFRDKGTDAIRFTAPPPHYDNIGAYRTRGVEVAVGVDPGDTVHTFAAYTYLDPEPSDLPYAPGHTAQCGVNWDANPRLRLSVDGQYIGQRWSGNLRYPGQRVALDGFFLLNARVQIHLSPDSWRERLVAFAGLENVTDARYQYQPGYDMPGITFLGGLRLTMGRVNRR